MRLCFAIVAMLLTVFGFDQKTFAKSEMVKLPAGSYAPFYKLKNKGDLKEPSDVKLDEFFLDKREITNSEFLTFVRKHPKWSRTKVRRIFAENGYLKQWSSELSFLRALADKPVVNVSWFAAQAYCESEGKSLPTTDQWEYALNDNGRTAKAVQDQSLLWFEKPNSDNAVATQFVNEFGIQNLVGSAWEWTLDFKDFLILTSDNKSFFCGNGSQAATNKEDYPAFMRYSFRSSLKASFVTNNLGFRCAKEIK